MVNVAVTSKFPAALLTTEDVGVFGNDEGTHLTAAIDTDDTTLSLAAVDDLEEHQWLALRGVDGFELTQVDSVNLGQLQVTVTRGKDGTVGVAHSQGQVVKSVIPAVALNQLRADLIGVESWLGADGDCITWDRALKLSPTHDTCPVLELDLKSATTNTEFIRFSSNGVQTGAIRYDAVNDAVEFQNIRVDIGTGADLLLEDDRLFRLGTDSDAQLLYRSADDRVEWISDKALRFETTAGTEFLTIDAPNSLLVANADLVPRTDSARSLGTASLRFLSAHLDRVAFAVDAAAPGHAEGTLFYEGTNNDKSLSFYTDEADIKLNVGQESWVRIRNDSGATIADGSVVYINGVHGGTGLPTVALAQANALATAEAVGMATHDIENNSFGYITTYGKVRDVDTSAFTAGTEVFLSASTPGAITATRPSHPNYTVRIGVIARSNLNNGAIFIQPDGPKEGLFTEGSVLFASATGVASEDNAGLFYEAASGNLGLGTAAPNDGGLGSYERILHVKADAGDSVLNIDCATGGFSSVNLVESGAWRYQFRYAGGANAFQIVTADGDGAGTAAVALRIVDGTDDVDIPSGALRVGGVQVVSSQQSAVANPSGGATVDTEARAAIDSILARLRTHGLIAT